MDKLVWSSIKMNSDQQTFICIVKIQVVKVIGQISFKLQIMTTVIIHLHINLKVKAILKQNNMTQLQVQGLTYKFGRMRQQAI